MRERATSLQKNLADRALKEQRDMRAILTELKNQISQEIKQLSGPIQLTLAGFSREESQQVERDLAALEARVQEIDAEIEQEEQRVQKRFEKPQPRLFPVTVTYIVPERFAR